MGINKPVLKKVEKTNTETENIKKRKLNLKYDKLKNEYLERILSDTGKMNSLKEIIHNSKSDYEVFLKYSNDYDYNELVYLNLMTRQDVEKFNTIKNLEKDNQQMLNNSINNFINNNEINYYEKEFSSFIKKNEEYNLSKNPLYEYQQSKNSQNSLPNIYIFGNKKDFEKVLIMSLETNVNLIENMNNLEEFEKDTKNKIVILTENANTIIAGRYNEIFEKQKFKTLRTFTFDGDNEKEKYYIKDFNRKCFLEKIKERD